MAAICLSFSACASGPKSAGVPVRVAPDVQTLNSGDVIRITFPTNPNLDTTQTIRRDGRINLYLIGEVKVVDKTPAELERELLQAYESQLTSKEITVTVISSSITVFVAGAVARPGKVTADRALTAFDAIMEAGGLDPAKSKPKDVRVIRQEDGQVKSYPLNMKAVLDGVTTEPFYLKPYDTVFVPERISWF
jgi:polysaccharide biosynthesis/export protein